MISKRCLLVLVVMGLTFLFAPTAHPATKDEIKSLVGLKGVYVLVEVTEKSDKKRFDEDKIRVDVELKLRLAGIKVLSIEELKDTPGKPILSVRMHIVRGSYKIPTFGCLVSFELRQKVLLERALPADLMSTTWGEDYVAAVNEDQISQIRNDIKDHLDGFINDYLSVNPKGGN